MTASIWNPGTTTITPSSNGSGTVTESVVLGNGQAVVNLTTFSYTTGVGALIVSLSGSTLVSGQDYTEASTTSIILTDASGVLAGDVITIVGIVYLGGGGTSASALGGIALGSTTIDHYTPSARFMVVDTIPKGWNIDTGRMTFEATMVTTGYYTANPNGHFAIVLRADTGVIATAVRGQGILIGNATGFSHKASDLNPTSMIETWFNGYGIDNFTYPNSETARSRKMADGVTYKLMVDSTKCNDGNRYIRYRLYSFDVTYGDWEALVDTGDVLDFNSWADLTQSGLVIGNVFESNLNTWSIAFSNMKVTWGPAENPVPDQTAKLSRYGAQLEGDLNVLGNGRQLTFPWIAGPDLTNGYKFKTSTANQATTLIAVPNGSATIANMMFTNNSVMGAPYKTGVFGISGSKIVVSSLDSSLATSPDIDIAPGGTTITTFKPTGIHMAGSTLGIGQALTWAQTNWGGSVATTFATTVVLDMDVSSTIGTITTILGGSYSAGNIENVVRPLYALLSHLIKNLKDKKVI